MDYKDYKEQKERLSSIVSSVIKNVEDSEYDKITGNEVSPLDELKETQARLNDENLKVLVMGKFSSGKSAFLNGMIGRSLLPMGARPKTAVIGEITFKEESKITLTPKPGKWKGGDAPFLIQESELDKYTSIEHTADGAQENPFKLVEIEYPLEICKNGIEFVDSPGLDDPTSHDEITKQYLPKADAIIYCMSSLQAYTDKDRVEIDSLRAMGYKSIIFVLTYFDQLLKNDEIMGTNDAETLKKDMLNTLVPLTDLGESGIFFVNSLAAILGKKKGDTQLLASSNFPDLEKKIEQILVNEKGRLKLTRSIYSAKDINKRVGYFIRDTINLAEKDYTNFTGNLTRAQTALDAAKQKAQNIETSIESGIINIASGAKDKGELYLMNEIIPSIDSWVNNYEAEGGINVIHLKSSITNYTEEHIANIKSKMTSSLSEWSDTELVKEYIIPKFEELLIEQRDSLSKYVSDLSSVRVNLELPIDGGEIAGKVGPSDGSRILAPITALLIGDIGSAIVGGALGFRGMLTTLAYELTAGIVLGIASMFTPVGLPALIIAIILAVVAGWGHNIFNIKNNIKKKIISKTKEILSSVDEKDEFGYSIQEAVTKSLSAIKEKLHIELQIPINESQKLVDQARNDMSKTGVDIQEKVTLLQGVLKHQEEADDALEKFLRSIIS